MKAPLNSAANLMLGERVRLLVDTALSERYRSGEIEQASGRRQQHKQEAVQALQAALTAME